MELSLVHEMAMSGGAFAAVVANHWARGGAGAADLGSAVVAACAVAKECITPTFKYELFLFFLIFSLLKSCWFILISLYPLDFSIH